MLKPFFLIYIITEINTFSIYNTQNKLEFWLSRKGGREFNTFLEASKEDFIFHKFTFFPHSDMAILSLTI